ncbi:MAG TPA: sulfatase-like hydrolase/transferase, partial [Thermoanaerobaculia bacterium]|nr:sulfatase-like hydrolase/transferase [Thermoanaerobaculia bacterium]
AAGPTPPPNVLLLTLDTTRADALGAYGGGAATPALDDLAGRGTRWDDALTPVPLTLPAHASLLTGLDPPAHGVRDNGTAALPEDLPTLATALVARGFDAAAFVSSRVLDRRFGLARGFGHYDDALPAEQLGEHGYPERTARQTTDAALAWLARRSSVDAPLLLWVHYYDPHAPYTPPGPSAPSPHRRYLGEVAAMDAEIGRLLAALPGGSGQWLVAAVGDHGEMLGEHGEAEHGIFLYQGSLRVPLIVAGPGVPAGRVVAETTPIRGLAATLWNLVAAGSDPQHPFGPPLPGLGAASPGGASEESSTAAPTGVYSETHLPATAYGWSPLTAFTASGWRLVVAPRPELYDLGSDPGETENLFDLHPARARRLAATLRRHQASLPERDAAPVADAALAADLRRLGYLSGSTGASTSGLDPKDGIALLARFDDAQALLDAGHAAEALPRLEALVAASPGSVPFLTTLGRAQFLAGRPQQAVATYRRAARLNPRLDLLHVSLADALLAVGEVEEARAELELARDLDPRAARPWLRLAQLEAEAGRPAEARRLLQQAVDSGTASASLLTRLAALDLAAGDRAAADAHLRDALRLVPAWPPAWSLWADLAAAEGKAAQAAERRQKAARAAAGRPVAPPSAGD